MTLSQYRLLHLSLQRIVKEVNKKKMINRSRNVEHPGTIKQNRIKVLDNKKKNVL